MHFPPELRAMARFLAFPITPIWAVWTVASVPSEALPPDALDWPCPRLPPLSAMLEMRRDVD